MKTVLVIGYGSIGKRHVLNILKNTNFKIILISKRQKINSNDFKEISQN